MRISTSTLFNVNVAQLDTLQSNLLQTQQQISTGQRILTPADDPAGAARALQVTQTDATNTQYLSNIGTAQDSVTLAEGTLQGVTTLLQNIQTTVVSAGNPSLADSDRQILAGTLQSNLTQLISMANSTDATGNYLFSGFKGTTQPFVQTPTGVQYQGDNGQLMTQVSANEQLATSDSGANIFVNIKNGNGTFVTQAAAANTGTGIASQGNVINPAAINGDSYQVVFTSPAAYNVYDMTAITPQAAATNTGSVSVVAGSVAVTNPAVLNNDTYQVVFSTPPDTYAVNDTTTGTPVSTGNAYVSGQPISFNGVQFNMQGAPANGDTFTINSNNQSVLNSSGAYVSGQAISFGGMQFDIQGAPATNDQFTVQPSTNESVFQTISNFITALNKPVTGNPAGGAQLTAGVSTALNNLNNDMNSVLTVQASQGTRLNQLTALTTNGNSLHVQYQQTLMNLQDVDMTQAVTNLDQQQTMLTAAQKSFTEVQSLSLFNYIS